MVVNQQTDCENVNLMKKPVLNQLGKLDPALRTNVVGVPDQIEQGSERHKKNIENFQVENEKATCILSKKYEYEEIIHSLTKRKGTTMVMSNNN